MADDGDGAGGILAFGRFTLDIEGRRLSADGAAVPLGGRAMDLLIALATQPGVLLGRDALLAQVWPDRVVEENSLRVHVAALRRALGDAADGGRWIANVPGRGYMFVAEVRRDVAPRPAAPAPPEPPPMRTGAVIGREAALAHVGALLQRCRLVTVVGPGGIGKTTVALALAHTLRPRFPDGVVFIDLCTLAAGGAVLPAVAGALGVQACPAAMPGALCDFVRERRMLLVFDNCEHVAEAAADIVERLLLAAAGVHVLATSREPLALQAETLHWLAPLDTPPPSDRLCAGEAMAHAALQLFVLRASASDDAFRLADETAAAAAFLCRQLDGNPLAIELAAARVASLGLRRLASGIDDMLGVLTRGRRTADPRHQTLNAMLDWSHRLLGARERRVFSRLSVFRSSFTLASALAVCADAPGGESDVIDAIADLGMKSLVAVERGAPTRYRLLHTTRAYAAQRCAQNGEAALVAGRHAGAMLALYRKAEQDGNTLSASAWRALYAATADDYLAAVDWTLGPGGDPALGIELAAVGAPSMVSLGRWDAYHQRACAALAALERLETRGAHADAELRLLCSQLLQAAFTNDALDSRPVCARIEALLVEIGSPTQTLHGLTRMFQLAYTGGDFLAAQAIGRRALGLAATIDDPVGTLMGERCLAVALHYLGDDRAAAAYAERALASPVHQPNVYLLGNVPRAISLRVVQARIAWLAGDSRRALEIAQEALRQADGEHPMALCQALAMGVIPIAWWSGEPALAEMYRQRLEDMASRFAMRFWSGWVAGYRGVFRGTAPGPIDNPMLADMLGTMGVAAAVAPAYARVREGKVGWCAPEILRAQGEAILRLAVPGAANGAANGAEALFLEALAMARQREAWPWALRCALSLARLWAGGERAARGMRELADVCAHFGADAASPDLREARALLGTRIHTFSQQRAEAFR